MTLTRRNLTGALLAGLAPAMAWPQNFPSRPITIVAPYSPGGGSDSLIRAAASKMQEILGQPVVIDNRPGASGLVAAQIVARNQPADGHTLFFGGPGHFAINQSLFRKMPYEARELVPVTIAGHLPFVLLVNPQVVAARNLQELVELSKRTAEGLSYGSTGAGTQPHLMMMLLERQTGLKLKPVVYKGGSPVVQDLLGGHIQLSALDFGTTSGLIQSNKLRGIAVSSPQRVPAFADIPTLSESGANGFSVTGWHGIAARAGTPQPIIDRLASAYALAIADPIVHKKITDLFIRPAAGTPQELGALVQAETERYARIIRDANITIEQ